MHISGLVAHCRPDCMQDCVTAINALPGAEVFHIDSGSGRIVIVQEAEATDGEIETFERIRALPGVLALSLVYHQFHDAESEPGHTSPAAGAAEAAS